MTDVATRPERTVVVMGEDEARKLTAKIRRGAENLRDLLVQAETGGAWKAMGYRSWTAYLTGEFDISPGHAGRLLFQAKAIKEIVEVTGLPEAVVAGSISARAAAELGPEGVHEVAQHVKQDQGNGRRTPLLERSRNLRETVEEKRAAARATAPEAPEAKEPEPSEPAEAPQQAHTPADEPADREGPPETQRGARRHPGVILPTGEAPESKLTQAAHVLQQILQLPPALVATTYLKVPPEKRLIDPIAMPNLIEAWADAFADELAPF